MEGGRFQQKQRFHSTFFDLSIGAQREFEFGSVGVAVNFEKNWLHFPFCGKNDRYTGQGAIYGLWRANKFYFFTDLIIGGSQSDMKRSIHFGHINRKTHSQPKFYHGAWYGEAGVDYQWKKLLIQPFFGVDATYVSARKVYERGANSLNLNIDAYQTTCPDTFLGAHLTLCKTRTELSGDLIWRARLGSLGTKVHSEFQTFGDLFTIKGCDSGRNSLIGRLRVAREVRGVRVYGEFARESAYRSHNWSLLGGLSYSW